MKINFNRNFDCDGPCHLYARDRTSTTARLDGLFIQSLAERFRYPNVSRLSVLADRQPQNDDALKVLPERLFPRRTQALCVDTPHG